jgi:hypothetical protein
LAPLVLFRPNRPATIPDRVFQATLWAPQADHSRRTLTVAKIILPYSECSELAGRLFELADRQAAADMRNAARPPSAPWRPSASKKSRRLCSTRLSTRKTAPMGKNEPLYAFATRVLDTANQLLEPIGKGAES